MHRITCEAAITHACISAKTKLMAGASIALWLAASPSFGQNAPASGSSPPLPAAGQDTKVTEVIVRAERPAVATSIDRTTYNVSKDLQGATGSVSDVLRNLPSVNVDVRGNVTLRGDASVQILVDGQPSTMFSEGNRAQALQQLSASTVESIEVMTNPSAEFRPDGTGGIINIVTKKVKRPGRSGSVQAGVGSPGRWNLNLLGAYNDGPLSLNGSLGVRRTGGHGRSEGETVRTESATGEETAISERSRHAYASKSANASTGLDYDLSPRDRLSLAASLMANEDTPYRLGQQIRSKLNGQVTNGFNSLEILPYDNATTQLTASWRRTYKEPGRTLSVLLRQSRSSEDSTLRTTYDFLFAPRRIEERVRENATTKQTVAIGYALPLAKDAVLKFGYDYSRDRNDDDVRGAVIEGPAGPAPIVNATNHFIYVQDNHQLYSTYQRPFGKFTVLGGLRLERAAIDYNQITSAIRGGDDFFNFHPSAHVQYALTENQKLTFSYSHRVQRPSGGQLNPFLVVKDDFNASVGNPNLRPQEAHAVEAKWQGRLDGHTLTATLYGRQTYNTIGRVSRLVTPALLLETYENQGTSQSGGLELDGNGKLGPAVSYRLNANLSYRQLRSSSEDGSVLRSAYAFTTRAALDWRPTSADFFQVTGSYQGRQLTSQGFRKPWGLIHLGYQRKLRPDLIATLTISDLFDSAHDTEIMRTRAVRGITRDFGVGRTVSFAITRQLGGKPVKEKQFEYEESR